MIYGFMYKIGYWIDAKNLHWFTLYSLVVFHAVAQILKWYHLNFVEDEVQNF